MARIVGLLAALVWTVLCLPATAAPLEAYGALPTIESVAISPDGQHLAIVATNGDQRTVIIQRTADGAAEGGLRVGDTPIVALQWAGSNHVLTTILVHKPLAGDVIFGSSDHWGVIDFNVATQKQTPLMSNLRESLNVVYEIPTIRIIDGKPYAFLEGQHFVSGEGTLSLFRADLDGGFTTLVETGLPHSTGWIVDAAGKPLAQSTYDAPSAKWTLRLRDGDGWRTVKTVTAPIERPSIRGLGRDGRSVLIADSIGNVPVLREIARDAADWSEPIHTGRVGPIWDISGSGALIGYGALDGDDRRLTFFDPQDQRRWRGVLGAYPDQTVTLAGAGAASADHQKLVVVVDFPTEGPAYALVDLAARHAGWIGPIRAGLKADDIGEQKPVTFKAADGLELHGYLTLPHGREAKALPLIVFPHGGPAARDDPGFDWWAQAMASRGYAVLQVNYRGSSGYGWDFLSAGFGQWGRKMQTDLSDGVRYLAAQGTIDPKRVCIVGASYGGYAALAGATIDRGVYRCAAAVAGVSDLRRMVSRDKSGSGRQGVGVERYWLRFMGVEALDDPRLAQISPALMADKVAIPILLVHGVNDFTVPFEQSRIMADALKKAGKPVTLVPLKGEDHSLSRGETRLQMLKAVVDFLERNNPPG